MRNTDKISIKAAIFDMDGTLVDTLGSWKEVFSGLGERFLCDSGFTPDMDVDRMCRTMTIAEGMRLVRERHFPSADERSVLDSAMELFVKYYKERATLKDGVRELLDTFLVRGVRMALATASPMLFVNIALERFGLRGYFDEIISCEEVGRNKEFPDVFIEARKRLGAELPRTWVFEDSLTAIKTAARAGFNTVGIFDKYNFGCEEASRIATEYIKEGDSLARLIPLLEVDS